MARISKFGVVVPGPSTRKEKREKERVKEFEINYRDSSLWFDHRKTDLKI